MVGSPDGARLVLHKLTSHLITVTGILVVGITSMSLGHAQESNGIKIGEGRLHPFVHIDNHWVTNPGYQNAGATSDLVTSTRPGLQLELPSETLELSFDSDFGYQKYWGIQNPDTAKLSTLSGQGGLDLNINKNGSASLHLSNHLTRSADPGNQTYSQRLLHVIDTGNVGLDLKPGGGALILGLGYGFFYDRYDRKANNGGVANPATLDNFRHMPNLKITWKFLPKTAIFLEGQGQMTRFNKAKIGTTGASNVDSNLVMAYAGASGNVTQKVTMLLKGGYGNTLVKGGLSDNFASFVGQTEAGYAMSEINKVTLGFLRTAQPTSFYKYYSLTRAYVRYNQMLPSETEISVGVDYNLLQFGQPVITEAMKAAAAADPNAKPFSTKRDDQNVVGNFVITQKVNEWLSVSVLDRLDYRKSNGKIGTGSPGYFNNDFYLRIDARY